MRSSVNKNIAKPLHEVLTRQHLWQVSQFSSLLNNESNTSSQQVSDSTGETQKAEKCLFESTGCRYSPGNCEVIYLNGQQIINKRHVPNNEDRVATTTFYYEPSFVDRDEIEQANSGSNNVGYSVVSYHTTTCGPREFESPEKYSSYKEHIENIEDCVELDNSKESEYANKNSNCRNSYNTEPNDKLKQFKEGVIEKIKQGHYASTSTFNNKQLNLRETYGPNTVITIEPSCDNQETENEYVRSILNGIPSQNNLYNGNYNLTSKFPDGANYSDKNRNEYHNATSKSKNSGSDKKYEEENFRCHWVSKSLQPPVQLGIAIKDSKKYSQSEDISDTSNSYKVNDDNNQFKFNMVPLRINLKNKGVNDERPQLDQSTSMISKNSTLIDSQNQTTRGETEEFHSRSYSLRNGYDESDILKQELTTLDVSDRRFHSFSESSNIRNDFNNNQPESYRLRNGFTPSKLQKNSSNAIPVKQEYPEYKKGSFGSNFKKYIKTEIISLPQYSSNREPLTILNDSGIIESSQIDAQEETTTHPTNRNNDEPKVECQTSSGSNDKDKPLSEKYIKSDITVLGHQNDAPKEYAIGKIFNSETFNEKENSLNKEFKIQNNKHLESTLTDQHLESNQIGSYYQSDRQNKVLSESTQLEFKPVTQSQDSEVKKQVTTNVKPSNISQEKSGKSEALNKIAIPAKENIITSALKSTSFQSGCTKDIKGDKNESVPFMLVKSKPPEQCLQSNKPKTNTTESAFHNSSKLGNCNIDSVIDGKLVAESYKQKSKKNLLKESEHSQKLTLKMDIFKDKTKTNSLNNTSINSKASETQKVEINEVTSKDNQSCKAKVQGVINMVDDREKGAEITFPGITPPTFSIPVSYENVNKCAQKPKGKADAAEKSTSVNKANTNKDIATFNTTGTREFNFKLGKNESIQSKISTEISNKNKTQNSVMLNNTRQVTELQTNNVINLNNKNNGKSTGHPSNKKEIDDFEARKARVNSVKPELKKLVNCKLLKENNWSDHSRDSHLNPLNADKLATLLKEHRVLLELLLEKLNGRMPPTQSENSSGIKKNTQPPEEFKISDSQGGVSKTEQFKKMLAQRINNQEKIKRLHPRQIEPSRTISNLEDVSKEEDVTTESTGPKPPSYNNNYRDIVPLQDSRIYPKRNIDKPLKRFHVVTMMTSPSGRLSPKKSESLLDGTKLSKYNFSPLKQILSQYKVDWSIKPRRLKPVDRIPLISSSINKKCIHKGVYDKTNWRNIYYASNLNTSEKNEKSGKSKENNSLVKKITIVNKKKNYNIRDNIKKRHLNAKNKTQISFLSNVVKKTKIYSALVKQEQVKNDEGKKDVKTDKGEKDAKTGDVENTIDKSTEENNVKLSKGIIFDSTKREFHKSGNKNYSSICTLLNNEIKVKSVKTVKKEKQKSRSLKDVEKMFTFIRPSENQRPSFSGLESKSDFFNLEYSNNIIKGPMWVATPEYNHNKIQWNLPARPNSTNTDTINNKVKINEINKIDTGKTIDVVNSLSKKLISLSEVMSLPSKTNLSRPSSVLVSKSSVLPLPLNFFNRKSIPKSETDISKTVGIKKISTCKTDKDYERGEVFKLPKHFSDSTILPVPSINSNINGPYVNQQDYKELDTVTNAPDLATNNLLGSYKDSKCSKYSIARNNLLFGRIRKSDILNTIKPSFYSFRSMSHKDSSTCKDEDSLYKTEEKLEMLPEKKILTNKQYFKYITSTARIDSIKFSWTRILNKVKHMVKAKCGIDNSGCCVPNFDEMMTSISKDVEKKCWEKVSPPQKNPITNKFSKQLRSKELALIMEIKGKSVSRNTHSNGEPKVLIIPKFLKEKVKNF